VYGEDWIENLHAKNIMAELHERAGVTPGMPIYMNVHEFNAFTRSVWRRMMRSRV
jgi:hypothetical protein